MEEEEEKGILIIKNITTTNKLTKVINSNYTNYNLKIMISFRNNITLHNLKKIKKMDNKSIYHYCTMILRLLQNNLKSF